ncbi:MAG: ABC transporter permease [Armatimonadetes bacterium]|nr:ABC transporter permease [Armatimonadota bacterium]
MPGLVLALFVLTVLGASMVTLIGMMAFLFMPRTMRTIRSAVLSIKEMPYVESARAIGASTPRILIRYIFPQILALYIVLVSLIIGTAIILETSLSFLGLGLPINTPSWGNLINFGIGDVFFTGWRQVIPPGIAIAAAVFGFNLLGDALRDVFDPRLRGSGVGLRSRGGSGAGT